MAIDAAQKFRYFGGWGFILGDHGSGAWLGRGLLQACLLAHDGIRPGSPLTSDVMIEFKGGPARLVAFASRATPRDFGRYAPRVFAAAANGDHIALDLLKAGASGIEETLTAVIASGASRLCLLGGLAPLYPPFLSAPIHAHLVPAEGDALSGAVRLAVTHFVQEVEP